jgi:hypothetical protein
MERSLNLEGTNRELTEAMSYLSPLERWLWGRTMERNLRNPDSRWHKMLPKYGKRGATLSIVGSVWFLPGYLGFPAIVLLEGNRSGSAPRMGVGIFLAAIAVVSIGFGCWRTLSAIRTGRRFGAGNP